MASLPRRPKGLIQREVIDLPTTAPPLYSTQAAIVSCAVSMTCGLTFGPEGPGGDDRKSHISPKNPEYPRWAGGRKLFGIAELGKAIAMIVVALNN
jgi:hypothetical protein